MNRSLVAMFVTTALSVAYSASGMADTVRLHGSTTVISIVVAPNRASIEKSTGHTLEIVGNGTGKGLVDLVEGKADVSMISEPLDFALASAEFTGKKIDPKTLQFHEVKKDEVVFVVHPSNPITSLTWEQLSDIHTGKITNWKAVGGKDQPITVYAETPTGGNRGMVKKVVMGNAEFAATLKSLTSAARVAEMVGGDEGGVGGVGKSMVISGKNKIVQTKRLERPLGLVTLGAPSAKVSQVIEALKAAAK